MPLVAGGGYGVRWPIEEIAVTLGASMPLVAGGVTAAPRLLGL
jgi:hypothetical protein